MGKTYSKKNIMPGTPEFGQRARMRGGIGKDERKKADLRIKTARRTARYLRDRTNKVLDEDY